jgi:CheY-like chemotaxis protein
MCGRIAPPLKALVIDDEEVSRFLIRSCLCDPGFEVIEAATAEEGLRRVRADRPDVVLLDLVLPDQHGREVLARLGDDPATSGLPVVIVTSTSLEPDERRALLARAHAVLAKAELSRETLRDAVRSAVRPQADAYTN